MYADADGLVLSPTDLTKHLGCPRATTLDLAVARRELEPPSGAGGALGLIFALGLEHEAAYLENPAQPRRHGRGGA